LYVGRARPEARVSIQEIGRTLERAAAAGLAAAVVSAFAPAQGGEDAWTLSEPAPAVALRPAALERPDEIACGACHAAELEEWSRSAHALAWVDEVYQEELAGRSRPETCHGCHIPEPLLAKGLAERPAPRADGVRFGVTCETCHLGPGGEMLGPRGAANEAHASARSEHLIGAGTNALCSACHRTNIGPVVGIAKDFETSGQAERGRTCVGCHMAPVEGGEGRAKRSHALQTPRDPSFLRRAFALRLEARGGKRELVIENRAGHRVPGLLGREIAFSARAVGDGGALGEARELVLDTRSYLPVDGEKRLELPPDAAGAAVQVAGEHRDPRGDGPIRFLDERLGP
jgi:hypothetical protein